MKFYWLPLFTLFLASLAGADPHTDPACWKESRTFHDGPVEPDLAKHISILKENGKLPSPSIAAPNKAYAYTLKNSSDHADILVYTERDYLLKISLTDIHAVEQPKWINEKLLFVRIWWGRIVASDLIIDVENEKLIYQEKLFDGGIAFQQAQEACKGASPCSSK